MGLRRQREILFLPFTLTFTVISPQVTHSTLDKKDVLATLEIALDFGTCVPLQNAETISTFLLMPQREAKNEFNEAWWKRALVVIGLVYINGYLASRAFYASIGLSPSDFSMAEYDYLMRGFLYLFPEFHSIIHIHLEFIWYYLTVFVTWILVWLTVKVAFWTPVKKSIWVQPTTLIILGVTTAAIATSQGSQRAVVLKALIEKLPNAIVYYKSQEHLEAVISGRLVSRTEKIVCLTKVDTWEIHGTNVISEADDRFFMVPFENVKMIILK